RGVDSNFQYRGTKARDLRSIRPGEGERGRFGTLPPAGGSPPPGRAPKMGPGAGLRDASRMRAEHARGRGATQRRPDRPLTAVGVLSRAPDSSARFTLMRARRNSREPRKALSIP